MAQLKCILRCSAILLLLTVTLAPAAPVTTPEPAVLQPPTTASPNGQEEVELESGTISPISTSSPAPPTDEWTEEMPTGSGQPPSTNGGSEIAVIVTTESPHGSFDCSATSTAAQAHATASLKKGLSLVIDDLSYDHLRHLIETPSSCPGYPLSVVNQGQHHTINFPSLPGPQKAANSIGKLNGYAELVSTSLAQNPADQNLQALHDILEGITEDLYTVLSPTFCTTCLDPLTTDQCFTVPQLDTDVFNPTCSLASYIANTISYELLGIEQALYTWLDSRVAGPLPEIGSQQWLDAHVPQNSPTYQILL